MFDFWAVKDLTFALERSADVYWAGTGRRRIPETRACPGPETPPALLRVTGVHSLNMQCREDVAIMVTSIILMNVERALINDVAELLASWGEISEVYSVSGSYDLVAIVRVACNEDLATLITEDLTKVDGIVHTETILAFRVYSRHDLEAMFAVGT